MKIKPGAFKIHYIIRLLLFWLAFFALYRLLFILYYHKVLSSHLSETFLSFVYGFRLDLSTACAATAIPFLFWAIQQFFKNRWIHRANLIFNAGCITLVSVLDIANLKIYGDWGTLLSARALHFVIYPREVLNFISIGDLSLLLFYWVLLTTAGIVFYRKFVTDFSYQATGIVKRIALAFSLLVLLVFGYRGGLQLAPINESSASYSTTPINNHIATNNIWYLGHSLVEANDSKNPYLFMEDKEAKAIVDGLYQTTGVHEEIIKTKQPNIVIIVLESWTADIIEKLGGEKGVTPHFNELCSDGLLFEQMYGSGFRTEQGLVSILSGFPAQPNNTIITTPSKAEKLPSLGIELEKLGYNSSFYYGGEIEFANMKAYLLNSHFKKIIDKNSFDKQQQNSKWGAHDEFVFKKQLSGLDEEQKPPFFSILLTLSTHEPFEVTMETPFNGNEEAEKFKKAAYYTDNCLFEYFKNAKQQPWYQNTLYILVADHGHHLPKNRNMNNPESRKITALITGGALKDSLRGKTVEKIVSQHDLPATILGALLQPHAQFNWSKDIFEDSNQQFAYYSNENVLGWVSPKQNLIYSFATQKTAIQPKTQSILNDTVLSQAKAYLETLYNTYLDY